MAAATTAAAALAVLLVMLLRRVTRWFALRAPVSIECELAREWACRGAMPPAAAELVEMEGRWVNGLDAGCIS